MKTTRSFVLALLLIGASSADQPVTAAEARLFTAQEIAADLDALEAGISGMHPQLSHSVDPSQLERTLVDLRKHFTQPADRDQIWRTFSTLNPVFADGHLFVGYASWREEVARHRQAGGRLFPFEVAVGVDGRVRIVAELGGAASSFAGQEIASINGEPASVVAQRLLAHMHGDSPRFRAGLLSQRWWFYYWKLQGAPERFELEWSEAGIPTLEREASHAQPAFLAAEDDFDQQFQFELLPGDAARLTVKTFAWPEPEQFLEFSRRAFERMQAAGTKTLLIDVRGNGGGDDAMWMRGLMPYLADQPYRWGSRYVKRVLRPDPAKNERVGDVVEGEIETWTPSQPDHALRFRGRTYVLVGATTYSSAVLFANTMQDFGFAAIAGEGASVRAKQSGGVQTILLPNTGLSVSVPRFVLIRPSGLSEPRWLTPDLVVLDDALKSEAMVQNVLAHDATRQ